MYFYMYDLENYASDLRGFYLDITKDLPGAIYRREESLCQDIKAGVYDRTRLDDFSKRFNNLDDGQASKRVLDLLAGEQ